MSSPAAEAPRESSPDDWARVPAAAQKLATSPRTLYRLAAERLVPFRRLPGTSIIAFAPEDIEAIKAASEVRPLRESA